MLKQAPVTSPPVCPIEFSGLRRIILLGTGVGCRGIHPPQGRGRPGRWGVRNARAGVVPGPPLSAPRGIRFWEGDSKTACKLPAFERMQQTSIGFWGVYPFGGEGAGRGERGGRDDEV